MDLKTLRAELQKLAALAEGWDASHEIADIERDLALGKLRELYDAVRFGLDSAVQPSVEDELSSVDLPPVEIDLDAVIPLTASRSERIRPLRRWKNRRSRRPLWNRLSPARPRRRSPPLRR